MVYWLGLGGNLGDRRGQLSRAVRSLATLGRVVRVSQAYETAPVGLPAGAPPFLNAVACLESDFSPHLLLAEMKAHEQASGRDLLTSHRRSRPIDLDILLAENLVLAAPGLTIPHPEMHRRRFVLAPLAEVAPMLIHPVLKRSVAELLADLEDEAAAAPTGWTPGE